MRNNISDALVERNASIQEVGQQRKARDMRGIGFFSYLICGVAWFVSAGTAGAQQIEMSSTLNPVGSGARATGMGGAAEEWFSPELSYSGEEK